MMSRISLELRAFQVGLKSGSTTEDSFSPGGSSENQNLPAVKGAFLGTTVQLVPDLQRAA